MVHENLHHLLAPLNQLDSCQWLRQPTAQPPGAHRCDGAIESTIQRSSARRVLLQRLENFQMPQGREIKSQKVSSLIEREPCEVRGLPAQILRQIVQHGTG